jgi:hypothetical protein
MTEIRGVARDAKLGAIVETEDRVVYCEGLARWPAGVSGSEVTVRGTLAQSDAFVMPSRYAAGTSGPIWILREWTRDA